MSAEFFKKINIDLDIFLGLAFTILLCFALFLLMIGKFSGTDFVAFTIAMMFFCFVIKVFPQISTMSIAGNTITLKEKIDEADKLAKQLIALRDMFISQSLNSLARSSGNNYELMKRFSDFVMLYNELILDKEIIATHKAKIEETIEYIAVGCLSFVKVFFKNGDDRAIIDKVTSIFQEFDGANNLQIGQQSGYEFSRMILTLNEMKNQLNSEVRKNAEISPYVIACTYASAAR